METSSWWDGGIEGEQDDLTRHSTVWPGVVVGMFLQMVVFVWMHIQGSVRR